MLHEKELVLFMRQANYISKMFEKILHPYFYND